MAVEYTPGRFSVASRSRQKETDLVDTLETQLTNLRARNEAVENPFDGRGPIETWLNLTPGQNFLQNLGEVIDRPVQAAKALVASTLTDTGVSPLEQASAAWRGETTMTGVELQQKLGWISEREVESMGGWEKFARNVTTDMVLDPLNLLDLIPNGLIAKGWENLTTVEKTQVQKFLTDGVKLAGDEAITKIDNLANELVNNQVINPNTIKKGSPGRPYTLDEARQFARQQEGILTVDELKNFNNKAAKRIEDFKNKYAGKSKEEILGTVTAKEYETYTYLEQMEQLKMWARRTGRSADELVPVLMGGSQSTYDDLGLYAKYMSGTEELYIPLSISDAKLSRTAAGSIGATVTMQSSIEGVVQFADAVRLPETSRLALQQAFDGVVLTDGTPLWQAMDQIIAGTYSTRSLNLTGDTLNAADVEKIQRGAKFILKEKFDYLKILAKDGTENFVKTDDIIDALNIRVSLNKTTKGGGGRQNRLIISIGLDHAHGVKVNGEYTQVFKPAWDAYIEQAVSKLPSEYEVVRTVRVGIISQLADGDSLLAGPAKVLMSIKEGLFNKLSWKSGLNQEAIQMIYRIDGSSRQLVYQQNQRLGVLNKVAKGQATIADEAISEFVELGGQYVVDPITGAARIEIPETNLQAQKVLDNFLPFAKEGEVYHIPIYSSTSAENVLTRLNDLYYSRFQVEDAFQFIQKGDKYYIKLRNIKYDDFRKFQQSGLIGEEMVNLGRKQLSAEMEQYLLRPEAIDIVKEYQRITTDLYDLLEEAIGLQNLPEFFTSTTGYVRHSLTKEGTDFIRQNAPLARSPYTREGVDFLKNRKYLGTKQDVNQGLQAWHNLDFNLFEPGIHASLQDLLQVAVTKQRQSDVLKTILEQTDKFNRPLFDVVQNTQKGSLGRDYQYITDFEAEFGNMYKNLTGDASNVLNEYLTSLGYTKGGNRVIAIHKTAYDYMKKMNNAYRELPGILKYYDKFMNQWKSLALLRPSFHIGNFFGNSTNMYLAGMGVVDQMTYVPRAAVALSNYDSYITKIDDIARARGIGFEEAAKFLPQAEYKNYQRLSHYFNDGVSMRMVGVQDLTSVKRSIEAGEGAKLPRRIIEANFRLAENADDIQRFALYNYLMDSQTRKLKRAGNLTDDVIELKARSYATQETFNTLYDYSNYTKFEQEVLKRLIPFYTFMKNNLIFQMKNIFRNPKQYARLFRAYDYYVSDVAGLSEQDMPEYARDNMWLPIPGTIMKNDKETISFLRTNLPIGDFTEFVDDPFKRGVSSITAPLKIPIELAFNRNVFTGAEIKEFPGEVSRLEEGTGVLPGLRNEQGTLALSGDPVVQRIANELGLRVPLQYVSIALDMADAQQGYQSYPDAFLSALDSLGVTSMKPKEDINVTNLYQLLEDERDKRYRWEQETGRPLPSKAELRIR